MRSEMNGTVYRVPVAHGEGRYFLGAEALEILEGNKQVLFRYCNENGDIHDDFTPNGSIKGIAGICNKERNVVGMMPHPERACNIILGNTSGVDLFSEIFDLRTATATA